MKLFAENPPDCQVFSARNNTVRLNSNGHLKMGRFRSRLRVHTMFVILISSLNFLH